MPFLLFPNSAQYADGGFLLLRIISAAVFFSSGSAHLKSPRKRAESLGLSVGFTLFLGGVEVLGALGILFGVLTQWAALGLILIMFGSIYMKVAKWKTGFWGEKAYGWHYDLIFILINLVILLTDGGRFTLSYWFVHRA
ncbi:MAG: DoxX family protein [Acidobacteriaceae bacterium]